MRLFFNNICFEVKKVNNEKNINNLFQKECRKDIKAIPLISVESKNKLLGQVIHLD